MLFTVADNSPFAASLYESFKFDTPLGYCRGFDQLRVIELGVMSKKKNNGDGGCPSKFSLKNEYPNGLKSISS